MSMKLKKSRRLNKWMQERGKLWKQCFNVISSQQELQIAMKTFLRYLTDDTELEKMKNEVKLCSVKSFVYFVHLRHEFMNEVMRKPSFEDLMAALLSFYIDFTYSSKRKLEHSDVSSLCSTIFIMLGHSKDHIVDALLQMDSSFSNRWLDLSIIIRKLIPSKSEQLSPENYLKLMILLRKWFENTCDLQKRGIKNIVKDIRIPQKWKKWLLNLGLRSLVSPNALKLNKISLTMHLITKLSAESCQAMLDAISESCEDEMSLTNQTFKPVLAESVDTENLFYVDKSANAQLLNDLSKDNTTEEESNTEDAKEPVLLDNVCMNISLVESQTGTQNIINDNFKSILSSTNTSTEISLHSTSEDYCKNIISINPIDVSNQHISKQKKQPKRSSLQKDTTEDKFASHYEKSVSSVTLEENSASASQNRRVKESVSGIKGEKMLQISDFSDKNFEHQTTKGSTQKKSTTRPLNKLEKSVAYKLADVSVDLYCLDESLISRSSSSSSQSPLFNGNQTDTLPEVTILPTTTKCLSLKKNSNTRNEAIGDSSTIKSMNDSGDLLLSSPYLPRKSPRNCKKDISTPSMKGSPPTNAERKLQSESSNTKRKIQSESSNANPKRQSIRILSKKQDGEIVQGSNIKVSAKKRSRITTSNENKEGLDETEQTNTPQRLNLLKRKYLASESEKESSPPSQRKINRSPKTGRPTPRQIYNLRTPYNLRIRRKE